MRNIFGPSFQSVRERVAGFAVVQRVASYFRSGAAIPWVRRLAVISAAGMFVVLVMGALVTDSGSQHGCGRSWPLCKGQFIPQFAMSTLIEYSHRSVTGIETILVLATTAGVLYYWRARREIRILAPLMVIFLFLQAGLGAMAVMFPTAPAILALHFGVSLISFVSILLTALLLLDWSGWDRLRDRRIPGGFRALAWGLTVFTYIVVYLGAYVRHRGVQLACLDWPLCNGKVVPVLEGGPGVVFLHRFAALLLTAGCVWLLAWAWRLRGPRPDLFASSVLVMVFVLLQALDGAAIVFSRLDIFTTLSHGGLVALLFGSLCYTSLHALPRPAAIREAEQTGRRRIKGAQRVRRQVTQPQHG